MADMVRSLVASMGHRCADGTSNLDPDACILGGILLGYHTYTTEGMSSFIYSKYNNRMTAIKLA